MTIVSSEEAVRGIVKALEAGTCYCGCHDLLLMHVEPCCYSCRKCGAMRIKLGDKCRHCEFWKNLDEEQKARGR